MFQASFGCSYLFQVLIGNDGFCGDAVVTQYLFVSELVADSFLALFSLLAFLSTSFCFFVAMAMSSLALMFGLCKDSGRKVMVSVDSFIFFPTFFRPCILDPRTNTVESWSSWKSYCSSSHLGPVLKYPTILRLS